MNPTLKKSLVSLAVTVAVTAVGYATNNLGSFGIPASYLPLAAAGLAIVMHWLDELLPSTAATTPSTSAQKTV